MAARPSPVVRLAVALVRLYQRASRLRPPVCRFSPSCSTYAIDALQSHGFWRGLMLAGRRLLRCHPWSEGGWDPVPPAVGLSTGDAVPRE